MRRSLQVLVGIAVAGAAAGGVALAATPPPAVSTGGVSSVDKTSAVVHGAVNPRGSATTYYFQWGLTTAYTASSAERSAGSGTKAIAVDATATHLTPGTIYHYRLVATSHSGTSVGVARTFKTAGHAPPAVTTDPVTQLNSSGAELTGTINPSDQATTWYFQWGSLNSFTQQTTPQALKASNTSQTVGWSLQGLLRPGTQYQYRLVGVHQGSAATYGATSFFMTYPAQRPYANVSASTRPRHRYRLPYVFTTTGSIAGPSWIPGQYACAGEIAVRFFHRHRRVRQTFVPVQPNCTFSASTTFPGIPRGLNAPAHLRVIVHFLSTAYLAPSQSRAERVTLG